MTFGTLRDHLRAHYRGASLPDQRAAALTHLLSERALAERSLQARTTFRSWILSATAAVVVVVFAAATLHYAYRAQSAEQRLERLLASTQTEPTAGGAAPRFVAVRTHAAGCPMCEGTLAAFDSLKKEFGESGVAFVTFEVASPDDQRLTESLARALGVEWALETCENCCAVRLLDRKERRIVATQQAFQQADPLREALQKMVPDRMPGGGAARPKGRRRKRGESASIRRVERFDPRRG